MPLNKLSIAWDPGAVVVFYRLPMTSATSIDRAVIEFAESGRGTVEWRAPYYYLRVGSYSVPFVIDHEARTLAVIRIYRIAR